MKTLKPSWFILFVALGALPAASAMADPDCSEYIESAKWGVEKVNAYFSTYPSLQITLTGSGCTYTAADTDAIFEQIYAKYSQDPEWQSPKLSKEQTRNSARLQLECQLSRSPVPNPITLEPRRETTSLDAYKAMNNCNAP
ncbi:hypothetical protein V0R50_12530 [Pseudomonas sp. 148P]|uniref:DUF2599 domain-containing protein n=1 Tax=Pseudomonas ulcerans TaxID=3115852 RepID=A0ABU7HRA5_9PSED|nr:MULTISPECIES: hypothetical protein [unclassified Pseudomonas]MEE1923090.1 hypothetical protein [Pseudomonas sp. 147P]MEE1934052.1 hypothetical protein [Pseudomonas sp. 148P]